MLLYAKRVHQLRRRVVTATLIFTILYTSWRQRVTVHAIDDEVAPLDATERNSTGFLSWNDYRIGDGIARQYDPPGCELYPGSIVCLYHQATRAANDLNVLEMVLKSVETTAGYEKAPDHAALVHVRLGDGLCGRIDPQCRGTRTDTPSCWERSSDCWYDPNSETKFYAYPRTWYHSVISELKNIQHDDKLIIVADKNHWTRTVDLRKGNFSVDDSYIEDVANFFRFHKFQVHIRQPNLPDQDFVFLCSAKVFVQGGGGFSKLVASIIEARGGTVVKPRLSR